MNGVPTCRGFAKTGAPPRIASVGGGAAVFKLHLAKSDFLVYYADGVLLRSNNMPPRLVEGRGIGFRVALCPGEPDHLTFCLGLT
jgi:hypothetical protein